jgi:hypothetical protein
MHGSTRERWLELCESAAAETDAKRFMAIVEEIIGLLEEKERRVIVATDERARHSFQIPLRLSGTTVMKKKRKRLHGIVKKVIKPVALDDPEKAEISIKEADDLYREIRVENILTDENDEKVSLKPGAEVDIVLEADTDATMKKTGPG